MAWDPRSERGRYPSGPEHSDHDTLVKVTLTLWGVNGTNGIAGTVKEHAERLKVLEQFSRDLHVIKDLGRWVLLGVSSLVAWLVSDPVAKAIAKVVKLLSAP